jgi:hypothetical protein
MKNKNLIETANSILSEAPSPRVIDTFKSIKKMEALKVLGKQLSKMFNDSKFDEVMRNEKQIKADMLELIKGVTNRIEELEIEVKP